MSNRFNKIPKTGLSQEELFNEMDNSMHSDIDWKSGKTFGAVYYLGEEYSKVITKAYIRFMHENAFDPQLFSSILTMENEVVEQTASLFSYEKDNLFGKQFYELFIVCFFRTNIHLIHRKFNKVIVRISEVK